MRETESTPSGPGDDGARGPARPQPAGRPRAWAPPAFRVVALDCEITAYAPDDEPLF